MKDIIFPITYKTDQRGLKDAEDGLTKLGNFAGKAGIAIAAGLAVAAGAAIAFGVESLKAAAEAEAITRGLENAAKNAGVFGDSSLSIGKATEALDKHSKKLGELTGIDDELINQLKTGWLAVPDLAAKGTDGINKLAVAAADIAKGTGKDISAVAMAFTKIAGDSETALSKLNRLGIVISDQQKATYEDILATNGEIAAQDYLLTTLGDKYAGAAAAAANPFERLDVIFGNLKETIGVALLPAFENIIPIIQDFIEQFVADPEFQAFLSGMSDTLANMLPRLEPVLDQFGVLLLELLPGLNPLLETFAGLVGITSNSLTLLHDENVNLFKDLENVAYIIGAVNDLFTWFNEAIDSTEINLGGFGPVVKAIFDAIGATINPIGSVLDRIVQAIKFINGTPVKAGIATNFSTGTQYSKMTPFATGGIVTGPTNALIGEAGPEAVIPLDKMSQVMNFRGGGSTVNISVNAGMGADGAAIGEQIVTAIRKYERTSGRVFAAA